MIRINGDQIRRIRESKGLTQLYLATFVGVTTDTVSRWENRKYPTIKKENAAKLAEALETDLAKILENPDSAEAVSEVFAHDQGNYRTSLPGPLKILWALLAFTVIFGFTAWWFTSVSDTSEIKAERILPRHSPPGSRLPIKIILTAHDQALYPLILKEVLPDGTRPVTGMPDFYSKGEKDNSIKWLSKKGEGKNSFFYMAEIDSQTKPETVLTFTGKVTSKKGKQATVNVQGMDAITVRPFHWADSNMDGVIDDDEILLIIDTFPWLEDLDLFQKEIETIWEAEGYTWDSTNKKFITIP
ncbi:MAG: helix-turn-helix domain-containing protein [Proteobacteria bacterium]|nr:helix-turn-helix domain-containing protein [Pseudomonadota bacterium]MBU1708667.1 helix-turn-helix domain-containing protein [Pseudomonadota bacterium]